MLEAETTDVHGDGHDPLKEGDDWKRRTWGVARCRTAPELLIAPLSKDPSFDMLGRHLERPAINDAGRRDGYKRRLQAAYLIPQPRC